MKKSLLFALAVTAAVVGCRKEQIASNDMQNGGKGGIRFETYVSGSSKGASKDQFVTGDRLEVIGYSATTDFTGAFTMPADAKLLFVGDTTYFPLHRAMVSASQGESSSQLIWNYHPMIYWPTTDGAPVKASFVAFSPEATEANKIFADTARIKTGTDRLGDASPAEPQIKFEVIGGSADYDQASMVAARLKNIEQIDLLNAQNLDIATAPAAGVSLEFKHALAKIRFSVKGAQSKGILRIVSITLAGVANKGTMKLMYDQTTSGDLDYLGGWKTETTDTLGFPVSLNSINAAAVDAGKVVPMVDNHEALLMIPQALADVTVSVVYAHSMDGGITWQKYTAGDGTRKILLATAGVPSWKPNMSINYVMDINPGKPVSFAPEFKDWDVSEEQYVPKFTLSGMPQSFTTIELEKNDVVTTEGDLNWITIEDPAVKPVVAKALSTAYTVAETTNHVLRVKANGKVNTGERKGQIKITRPHTDPKKVRVINIDVEQALLDVKMNDYYYADGTYATVLDKKKRPIGVVYFVDAADLANFKVVALDQSAAIVWGPANVQITGVTRPIGWTLAGGGAVTDAARLSGKSNGAHLLTWIADAVVNTTSKTAADFPTFNYCNTYKKWDVSDWSVPALNQLQRLYGAFNGKAAATLWLSGAGAAAGVAADATAQGKFNALFTAAEGVGMTTSAVYGTMTEDATVMANLWSVSFADGLTAATAKATAAPVRCVRDVVLE